MDDGCWDYIFNKGNYQAGCKVSEVNLKKMRHEFEYWYPLDLRCSAKDLIRNHLTMALYNHAAIWQDQKMMPRSIFCNGYLNLNDQKMSKSTGNFLTIRQSVEQFGVEATRMTFADAGDGLDDANFETGLADAAILKLYVLEKWIVDNIKASVPEGKFDFKKHRDSLDMWDNMFMNSITGGIIKATESYDQMKYRQALKYAFFQLQSMKEDYLIAKGGKANPFVLMRYLEVQMILMNPIIPHFAQYCWDHYLYPVFARSTNYLAKVSPNLCKQQWPEPGAPFNS